MMNFAGLHIEKHQDIVVTTKSGKFYGKFNKLSGDRLELSEVRNEEGKPCAKFKFFFNDDVVSIFNLDETSPCPESSGKKSNSSSLPQLSSHQLEHISQSINKSLFIKQADCHYFEAIADISKQLVFGIAAEGAFAGRIYNITTLSISTPDKIFIFDIMALNARKTFSELKEILESDAYLKVAFNSGGLKENLEYKFKITMAPVFDVMLAAAQFHPEDECKSINKCIANIIGLRLEIKSDMDSSDSSIIRPLSDITKKEIATKVAYNLAMYNKLASSLSTTLMMVHYEQDEPGDIHKLSLV